MEWWEVDQLYLMPETAVKSPLAIFQRFMKCLLNFVGPLCPVPFHSDSVISSPLKRAHASLHQPSFFFYITLSFTLRPTQMPQPRSTP